MSYEKVLEQLRFGNNNETIIELAVSVDSDVTNYIKGHRILNKSHTNVSEARSFVKYTTDLLTDPDDGWSAAIPGIIFRTRNKNRGGLTRRLIYIRLATPASVEEACPFDDAELKANTGDSLPLSCYRSGVDVILINVDNYLGLLNVYKNAKTDRDGYKRYVILHETGHALGFWHVLSCPEDGEDAPIMMQQTKGIGNCKPNSTPRIKKEMKAFGKDS